MKTSLRLFRFLGSPRVGIALLGVLFLLVFWGTLFEARAGLDWGVARFFDGWFLLVAGVFPFPAMKSLSVLLFLHLLFALMFRIPHTRKFFGVAVIHFSFLILIAGSLAGASTRRSFETFGIEGSEVVLDSAKNTAFRILEADSAGCRIGFPDAPGTFRIAWNAPRKIGNFDVYFAERFEMPETTVVRFWVRSDPFSMTPYLFAAVLAFGIFWNALANLRKSES